MSGDGYGTWPGQLEIRAKGGREYLSGYFPLNTTATVRAHGRTRKERFASGSMSWQVEAFQGLQDELADLVNKTVEKYRRKVIADKIAEIEAALESRNTHLLVGHSYDKAIADMKTGTLKVEHTRDAVKLEAALPVEGRRPSWVQDAVYGVEGGQLRGISPGFPGRGEGPRETDTRTRKPRGDDPRDRRRRRFRVFASLTARLPEHVGQGRPTDPPDGGESTRPTSAAHMAITLTAETLAEAIGAEDSPTVAARVLAVASQVITDYAPDAPDAVADEAAIRFAGYLYGSDYGAIRSEDLGPMTVSYATNHAAAFRFSGAAGLLTRYKRRRAGRI